MIFGRKKNSPENESPPPLPQAAHDFLRAVTPAGLSPLSDLQNRAAAAKAQRALPPSPGSGPHSTDKIVEIRIRQWLEEMEKAKNPAKPGISGHSPYYYPPHY